MLAAGQTEYAVRWLSLVAGVLIVALLYVLGRRLFGARAGLLAAACGAASPLLVYYSQETRMYAQVTLFGLLSTYLLVRAVPSPGSSGRISLWLGYSLATAACLYSQYIGVLALLFQGVYVLVARRKALLRFALAAGAAVVAFLPWLAVARDSLLSWPSTNAFQAGPRLFGDAAFRYVEGLSANVQPLTFALTAATVVFALVTLLRSRTAALLPALYLVVPILAMFALGFRKPVYNPKFALLALPGFLLLLGAGLDGLGRFRWAGLTVVLCAAGLALNGYYADPEFARDDYRGLAQVIASSARPGDAIVLDAPGQEQVFPYYYKGALPQIGLPEDRPLNPERTQAALERLNGTYRRLWLVLYGTNGSDPENYVEHWLASNDFEVLNQWFGDVRLAAFAVPSHEAPASRPANATIGGFAHLTGYTLTPEQVPSGDVLQLGLNWQAVGPAPGNEKVFTHVIDQEGNIWAQRDSDPAGGARPTSSWKPGEAIDDNYGLLVLPGTPPGQYQLEAGMYDPNSPAKRQPVTAGGEGDRLLLGRVQVTPAPQPPSLDELRIPHLLDRPFGSARQPDALRLLGYGLSLVGHDEERTTFAAGDELHLSLFWQADEKPKADLELAVWMLRRTETIRVVSNGGLVTPVHPTSTWLPDDRYRDQHRFTLPKDAHGDYDVFIQLLESDPLQLTRIHIL